MLLSQRLVIGRKSQLLNRTRLSQKKLRLKLKLRRSVKGGLKQSLLKKHIKDASEGSFVS